MADSTVIDVSELKVVDFRKELQTRGLFNAGDNVELIARRQTTLAQDDDEDINLDSDEIDSDGVLEDDYDKNHVDTLYDSAVNTLNEELALSERPAVVKSVSETCDKVELLARLQTALAQDDDDDINLDSDEIDSDGVLEDEYDKNHVDTLYDSAVNTLNEELALSEIPAVVKSVSKTKPQRTHTRKITVNSEPKNITEDSKPTEYKEVVAKNIVLNRTASITSVMADSTMMDVDVSELKVVDFRKELKTRGLFYAGDKGELIAPLQTPLAQDDDDDINLDSDSVLQDEYDKNHVDTLYDSAVNTLNEELALSERSAVVKSVSETKAQRTLTRKITVNTDPRNITEDGKPTENKEVVAKEIVLNRAASVTSATVDKTEASKESAEKNSTSSIKKLRITTNLSTKTRLQLRAIRFGLPVKISENERKEARKRRFGQNVSNQSKQVTSIQSGTLTEDMVKLRKRAERFGQSVSRIMTDIEKREKLEKRQANFNI